MTRDADVFSQLYAAFNQRKADNVLSHLTDDVSWPKASEGGRVHGKAAIHAYWNRQWQEFDPHVEPIEVVEREHGKVHVRVRQLVKDLAGNVLSESEVWHVYTLAGGGLIERMDLGEDADSSTEAPSAAFPRH